MKYVRPQRISFKTHSELNEKWVQERIAQSDRTQENTEKIRR
jgi:hypothetical protein